MKTHQPVVFLSLRRGTYVEMQLRDHGKPQTETLLSLLLNSLQKRQHHAEQLLRVLLPTPLQNLSVPPKGQDLLGQPPAVVLLSAVTEVLLSLPQNSPLLP